MSNLFIVNSIFSILLVTKLFESGIFSQIVLWINSKSAFVKFQFFSSTFIRFIILVLQSYKRSISSVIFSKLVHN